MYPFISRQEIFRYIRDDDGFVTGVSSEDYILTRYDSQSYQLLHLECHPPGYHKRVPPGGGTKVCTSQTVASLIFHQAITAIHQSCERYLEVCSIQNSRRKCSKVQNNTDLE